ncbi:flavodoxin domain-containing protein [Parvimonas sp. C2]|uniref:flavodoxin domain-containing protein n=1 Tax=Parvimonas sp. C2 TaxID=3110692 RepID=UPI002B45FE86|nr:flavodoxin domain-containing protein [Parvimonas sp. C2]MEB3073041.1 flavodoxin domain-containing protein [Parvimonas sp. C2]
MSSTMEYKSNKNLELSLDDNILYDKESFSPKVKVIYFSPTGTTKKTIKNVIKGIESKEVYYVDLTEENRISKTENIDTSKADLIILGAPVYGGFLYKDFRNYIKNIYFNNKAVAIVLLYGNATIMFSKREIISIVKKNNGNVVGYGEFIGEHSYSTKELPVAINRPNEEDINMAISFGKAIREELKNNIEKNKSLSLFDRFIGKVADIKPVHTGRRIFTIPKTDYELCDNCGVCIKKCPKACIDNNIVTDKNACIVCMACVKACHNNARISKAKNPLIKIGLKKINRNKNESKFIVF